jgi:hypothetical protein
MRKPLPLSATEWMCLVPTAVLALLILMAVGFVVFAIASLLIGL